MCQVHTILTISEKIHLLIDIFHNRKTRQELLFVLQLTRLKTRAFRVLDRDMKSTRLSETFRDFQIFSETFRDFQRFSEIFRDFQKLLQTFKEFFETFKDFQRGQLWLKSAKFD